MEKIELSHQDMPVKHVDEIVSVTVVENPAFQRMTELREKRNCTRKYLTKHSWPTGLQDVFLHNLSLIPVRFFICDDSGSMVTDDGHKFVFVRGSKRLIPCSRWAELTEFLKFHAGLSIASSAVCEFRLLNRSDFVRIGQGDEKENERYESLISLLNGSPGGGTPLCKHIREVTEEIKKVQHDLKIASQKACIIIATDGESSDGDILEALRPLRDLPAWVVIRLCTEEEKVVNYWNNIDKVLELDMLVLNDLRSEARAIFKYNPWLTYGEPLHRLREFGIPVKEIDLLDEVLLSPDQIRLFCHFLFGGSEDCYPNPVSHWQKFSELIEKKNEENRLIWNSVAKKDLQWIDTKGIKKCYKTKGCVIQ